MFISRCQYRLFKHYIWGPVPLCSHCDEFKTNSIGVTHVANCCIITCNIACVVLHVAADTRHHLLTDSDWAWGEHSITTGHIIMVTIQRWKIELHNKRKEREKRKDRIKTLISHNRELKRPAALVSVVAMVGSWGNLFPFLPSPSRPPVESTYFIMWSPSLVPDLKGLGTRLVKSEVVNPELETHTRCKRGGVKGG